MIEIERDIEVEIGIEITEEIANLVTWRKADASIVVKEATLKGTVLKLEEAQGADHLHKETSTREESTRAEATHHQDQEVEMTEESQEEVSQVEEVEALVRVMVEAQVDIILKVSMAKIKEADTIKGLKQIKELKQCRLTLQAWQLLPVNSIKSESSFDEKSRCLFDDFNL